MSRTCLHRFPENDGAAYEKWSGLERPAGGTDVLYGLVQSPRHASCIFWNLERKVVLPALACRAELVTVECLEGSGVDSGPPFRLPRRTLLRIVSHRISLYVALTFAVCGTKYF